MDELIDIVNEDNVIIGQAMKSEAHAKGLWHRLAVIWIYNSKGQILLQLRTKDRDLYPDVWDVSVGG
ncbi:MAG: NUDIX hydrolase, partial [Nanoarchaeota archaeon]|nr:NUDIX hydrolase [Nanoarchaeota archaeon]